MAHIVRCRGIPDAALKNTGDSLLPRNPDWPYHEDTPKVCEKRGNRDDSTLVSDDLSPPARRDDHRMQQHFADGQRRAARLCQARFAYRTDGLPLRR